MRWALKQATGSPITKLVLVALANYAGDDWSCWPSNARIAQDTHLSERAVRQAIAALRAEKLIATSSRFDDAGRQTANVVTLAGRQLDGANDDGVEGAPHAGGEAPDAGGGGTTCPPEGAPRAAPRGHHVPPNLSYEPIIGTKGEMRVEADAPPTLLALLDEPRSLPPAQPSKPIKPTTPDARGTRLPLNWRPSDRDWEFARSLGLDPNATLEVFRDYWREQPGAAGRKIGWDGTWRNWCKREAAKPRHRRAGEPAHEPGREPWAV